MKQLGNFLAVILVVGILAGMGWAGYLGITFLVDQFELISPAVGATVSILSVAILLGALLIAASIRSLDRGDDKVVHPEKAVLYNRLMEIWSAEIDRESAREIMELKHPMLLWAGDRVLSEFLDLNELLENHSDPSQTADQFLSLLQAMRKDLGAHNRGFDADRLASVMQTSPSAD